MYSRARGHCVHVCFLCECFELLDWFHMKNSLTTKTWRRNMRSRSESTRAFWSSRSSFSEVLNSSVETLPHWTASCGHLNRHRAVARPERDAAASRWNLRLHSSRAAQVRPLVNLKASNSLSAQAWRKGKKIKPHILSGSWQHVMSVSVVGVLRLVWQFSRD